jgi:hypothetical protein
MSHFEYRHQGACDCGAVSFAYHCGQSLEHMEARACQCEYCRPKDACYLSAPAAELRVTVKDLRYLYAHRFGTASADFMHCAVCNGQVFVRCEVGDEVYAVVSARALEGFESLGSILPVDHGTESLAERLARRAQCWIPVVVVASAERA